MCRLTFSLFTARTYFLPIYSSLRSRTRKNRVSFDAFHFTSARHVASCAKWIGRESLYCTDEGTTTKSYLHITGNRAEHTPSLCSLFYSSYDREVFTLLIRHLHNSAPCAHAKLSIFCTETRTLFRAPYFHHKFRTPMVKATQGKNENNNNKTRSNTKQYRSATPAIHIQLLKSWKEGTRPGTFHK